MNRLREVATHIMNVSGLDWIGVILIERRYKQFPRVDPEIIQSFENNQGYLDLDQLKDVIQELSKLTTEEQKRQETIEAKALSLISFASLSAAFVTGLLGILSDTEYSEVARNIILLFYSLLSFSLFITVVLSIKATRVGKAGFMWPRITNFWERNNQSETDYLRDYALTQLKCYIHNHGLINDKASFVAGAQDWFRNTSILLIFMTVVIVTSSFQPSMTSPSPTQTATTTATQSMTATQILTPMPSVSPTLLLPSPTPVPNSP